jgi:hypothetical protein
MADSKGAVAPAEPASDAPPSAAWRSGAFVAASGLVVSTVVHLLLVGTALFVSPLLLQSEPATSMTVDLVTPEELAAMSDKPAEPEKSQQAAGPEKPQQQTAAPAQPPPEPTQSQPPASPSAAAAASDAFAMPFLPPPAPPSAPASPDPSLGQAAQLAELVGLPSVTDLSGGGASDFKAGLTPEEIAAFTAHVQSCWSASADLAQATKLYVVIRVSLRRDGGLAAEPLPIAGSASAQGPALAQSAKRALQQCQPHNALPAAKYDEWRLLDLRFTGSGISTASPVSSAHRTARPG